MPRNRIAKNSHLPKHVRCRDGYFSWRNPVDGIELGLGRNEASALAEAEKRNAAMERRVVFIPEGDISLERIVSASVPVGTLCGVYFLIAASQVVYVGQSTNVHFRIATHLADNVIPFDRYHMEPCDRSLLDVLEQQYIAQFRPAHNKQFNPKRLYGATRQTTV